MANSIFRKDGTAQGVAKQRLMESLAKPDKRVIYDPFADKFVLGQLLMKFMGFNLGHWLTKQMAPGFHEHLVSRTKFIDDMVEEAAANGVEQYVILGAGYDSRPYRLALPRTLKIFEVDQEEVQRRKREKLPKDAPNLSNVTFVSVDFNKETLLEQLLASGFDPEKSTVFTLEGVSQYISKEALESTLKELHTLSVPEKNLLYLSYVDQNLKDNPKDAFGKGYRNPEKKAALIQKLSAKVGEPWISFYSQTEMKAVLAANGFSVLEDKRLEDLNPLYFVPKGRGLKENEIFNLEHSIKAISK